MGNLKRSIVILTGAGISAASGIATYRDTGGVWGKYDFRVVATPEGFAENPDLVHEFYNFRRREIAACLPNDAHLALARLEREWDGEFLLVTQNVDELHEAAGSKKVLHMHGRLNSSLCEHCGARHECTTDMSTATECPTCHEAGGMRPDVVWFGEMPYEMDRIERALANSTIFLSIGTSGKVYPAADFVTEAKLAGAETFEANLETSGRGGFNHFIEGPAERTLSLLVERLLTTE